MTHERENFESTRVELDGNRFFGCEFNKCQLVYRGGEFPVLRDSNVSQCQWVMDDAASRTLLFLHALRASGETLQVNEYIRLIKAGPNAPKRDARDSRAISQSIETSSRPHEAILHTDYESGHAALP
jgi:hypothetical protein